MILPPINDHECLGPVTDFARAVVADPSPEVLALARDLGSTTRVVEWIRSLPQRDDTGDPTDGPRVAACRPPQRLRLLAPDPNCFERMFQHAVFAELIDNVPSRRFATIDTPIGLHSLPVENGTPVVLDPRVPRNTAQSEIDVLVARAAPTDLAASAAWVSQVAAEPADNVPGGPRRVRNASGALARIASGEAVPPRLCDDVALVLALAAREAPKWGPAGMRVVDRVAQAVLDLHGGPARPRELDTTTQPLTPRNRDDRNARVRLRPAVRRTLVAALRTLGVAGLGAGTAIARAKLATLGITPAMLSLFESELNREGLTLGALSKPAPPAFSLAALTSDGLVARLLERTGAA
jgi:hypothetical protein